jgi:hypothetical protein
MTEGHTRGPWKYGWETSAREWALVTNSAGSVVANVNSESGPDAQSVPATRKMPAEANARLIAASPDLLAFAKAYDDYMAAHYSGPDSDALHPDAANNWRMCRAAIARAEGSAV